MKVEFIVLVSDQILNNQCLKADINDTSTVMSEVKSGIK